MCGSTSVRWIVHTLMPNRTYERQLLGVAPLITLHIVAINLAEIVATTNFSLDAGT